MNIKNLHDIFPLAVFFTVFSIVLYPNRKRCAFLRKLSQFSSGNMALYSFYLPTFKGEFSGFRFSIMLVLASKSSPATLNISLYKSLPFKLNIRKETLSSRIGEKIGLLHELKTGNAQFDEEFLVYSSDNAQAKDYLNRENNQEIIRGFFNDGFDFLQIDGKKAEIRKPNYILENDVDPLKIKDILQKLIQLTT